MAVPNLANVEPAELIHFSYMTLTPVQNGFLKGLAIVVLTAAVSFLGDAANLAPLIGNSAALIIAGLASSLESHIKDQTGKGLMGAVRIS